MGQLGGARAVRGGDERERSQPRRLGAVLRVAVLGLTVWFALRSRSTTRATAGR